MGRKSSAMVGHNRWFWSNMIMSFMVVLAVLKLGLHAFYCSRHETGWEGRMDLGLDDGRLAGLADELAATTTAGSRRWLEEGEGDWSRDAKAVLPQQPDLELSMTLFCAPKPFDLEDPDDAQRRALLSWLRLKPRPKVVLLGDDPSLAAIASEFPEGVVTVEADIDYNMRGMPMFHSIMYRARNADTNVSVVINGDIVLLQDFLVAMQKTAKMFDNWILTAMRWDMKTLPYRFVHRGKGVVELIKTSTGEQVLDEEVAAHGRELGVLHTYGGVDFWAWNVKTPDIPLHETIMPPFSFGRGRYDNWLTHHMVAEADKRAVVDASDAIVNIHVAHAYAHVGTGNDSAPVNFWSSNKRKSWEAFSNIHLSQTVGSFANQLGTALHIPWKMVTCMEPNLGNLCMTKRVKPASCTCEYSAHVNNTQTEPKLEGNRWRCGSVSVDQPFEIETTQAPGKEVVPGLPWTLDQLLPEVADENKTVVLVAVTAGYKEMLLNFICRLREMGITNVLIAALEEDLYKYAFTQGLPVYLENIPATFGNLSTAECPFGSQCFRQFTKLKSRAVLNVLRAGYNVLWTDVDIAWMKNPLPDMMSYGPGTLPIQSNEPNASIPGSGIRRINSGFYYARADQMTIEAFQAIVTHAAGTKLSEQPSFYDILCGVKGEKRVSDTECVYDNGLRTIFLDRKLYPNGAVYKIWEAEDVTRECLGLGCLMLHNNWIAGKGNKTERFVANGMWHYDVENRMCIHDWHPLRKLDAAQFKEQMMASLNRVGAL